MEKFNREAEKKYPLGSAQRQQYHSFISGCEFGYKEGVGEGMRFMSWQRDMYGWSNIFEQYYSYANTALHYTTAELFEIFKKEQDETVHESKG
jgi:hypothetical protein